VWFGAAGYNIDSLVVGRTEVEELSRMTVVVNGTAESVVNVRALYCRWGAARGLTFVGATLCLSCR
jgi:hypothetical protein